MHCMSPEGSPRSPAPSQMRTQGPVRCSGWSVLQLSTGLLTPDLGVPTTSLHPRMPHNEAWLGKGAGLVPSRQLLASQLPPKGLDIWLGEFPLP